MLVRTVSRRWLGDGMKMVHMEPARTSIADDEEDGFNVQQWTVDAGWAISFIPFGEIENEMNE